MDFQRTSWLRSLAVAAQDVELIDGSTYENITLAHPDAAPQEAAASAEVAGLSAVIASMPNGFETQIGERGLRLSGGQRQRIGIARALICNSDLLILDEATAHSTSSSTSLSVTTSLVRSRARPSS